MNLGVGNDAGDGVLEADGIAADHQFEMGDLAVAGAEQEDVGLTDAHADQVDLPVVAHDGVRDRRIGYQDVADILRQVDHHRLVEAEIDDPPLDLAHRTDGGDGHWRFCRSQRGRIGRTDY